MPRDVIARIGSVGLQGFVAISKFKLAGSREKWLLSPFSARTDYEDASETGRRLLYRMWLSMPNSRPLPPGHKVLFGATGAGAIRGGIAQATGETHPRAHRGPSATVSAR